MSVKRGRPGAVMVLSTLALGACVWLLGTGRASGQPPAGPADDGVPSGTIAFFEGGVCPDGWKTAEQVQGRMIVGVLNADQVGVKVGDPLVDREERAHQHGYAGQVTLVDKSLAAADGANNNGAAAKSYDISGTTSKQVPGLPFVQVQACEKP